MADGNRVHGDFPLSIVQLAAPFSCLGGGGSGGWGNGWFGLADWLDFEGTSSIPFYGSD